jgi:hypothetical protein
VTLSADPIGLARAAIGALRPLTPQQPASLEGSPLVALGAQAFEAAVYEALLTRGHAEALPIEPQAPAPPPPEAAEPAASPPRARAGVPPAGQGMPTAEATVIDREAERTGIDPQLLVALRRTENGGPGREFGVVGVSAPTLEAQARVAANTIRNTAQRYTEQGGELLDTTTGRYSEGFLRFLSARYAPVGVANDPTGLNRHHARNLIALYRQAHGEGG